MLRIALRLATLAAGAWMCAAPAHAQSAYRPYIGGALGTFVLEADEVDGQSAAAIILGGVSLNPYIDIEGEASFPTSTFNRSITGINTSFAPPGSTRAEIERLGVTSLTEWQREVTLNLSAVAIIHPRVTGRVVPALVAGVSNQRARNTTTRTPISIPAGIDPQHPTVVGGVERYTRNFGGPTIGGQCQIRVTSRFWVVPDLRYDYGSIGDEINNALRMSVRGIWRF